RAASATAASLRGRANTSVMSWTDSAFRSLPHRRLKTISRLLGETRLDSISGARHGRAAKGVPLGGRLGLREGERSDHLPTSRKWPGLQNTLRMGSASGR